MNKNKLLINIVLAILCVFSIILTIQAALNPEELEYSDAVNRAEDYESRGLYQLAIAEYKEALTYKDDMSTREAMLDAYGLRLEESETILEEYIEASEETLVLFPEETENYLRLYKLYVRRFDYQSAYNTLKQALDSGIQNEELTVEYQKIKYSFNIGWRSFNSIVPSQSGFYPVENVDGMWGYVDLTGADNGDLVYLYTSPYGDEGIHCVSTELSTMLIDGENIVRGKMGFVPSSAYTYSDELIAVKNTDKYSYYNCLGDEVFGDYKFASNFSDGKAAVSSDGQEWYFIDKTGNRVSDAYQDIKVDNNGCYNKSDRVFAKVNGTYQIFTSEMKPVSSFECDDIDTCINGGMIAYKENDLWGFVDIDGTSVIEPQYEAAKSFSNGFAAVCKDGKWGFIDEKGKLVIDYQFEDADYFNDQNKCMVKIDNENWSLLSFIVSF